MVKDSGQLYTIEGFAASVLLITTAYLVLSTTVIYTPAETHINDMQLELLGNDVLAALDIGETWVPNPAMAYPKSPLERFIENGTDNITDFESNFSSYLNFQTDKLDNLKFNATIYYRDTSDPVNPIKSSYYGGDEYFREHAVKVSRWVNVDNVDGDANDLGLNQRNQSVLLEVLIWRD